VRSFAQEDEEHLYIVVHGRPFLFETREVAKQVCVGGPRNTDK
jgi:hypothetical protein